MITAEQRQARRSVIGGSDVAAVLGMNPWKTAWDVWAEKRGLVAEGKSSEAADLGNMLEDPIVDWALEHLAAAAVRRDLVVQHAEHGFLAANLDTAIDLAGGQSAVIEAKTAGLMGPLSAEWGEEGTDQIPTHYILQVQHQMLCGGENYRVAYVPALLGGRGRQMFKVDRNERLIGAMLPALVAFWKDHVEAGVPPEQSAPSLDLAKRIRREPASVVELPDQVVADFEAAREACKRANDAKEEAEGRLLAALGTAEAGTFGGGMVTYLESQRKAYSVAASAYRSLRIKRTK